MPQMSRISRNNTRIVIDSDGTREVHLHRTCIVRVEPDGTIVLYTGGWLTATTVARMNQAANEWGLDYSAGRRGGEFSVRRRSTGEEIVAPDNRMIILPPRAARAAANAGTTTPASAHL